MSTNKTLSRMISDATATGLALLTAASATAARAALALGDLAIKDTVNDDDWSGTDLRVANGGTNASTAAEARTNLGLVIGTDVQAYDADLATLASTYVTGTFTPTFSFVTPGDLAANATSAFGTYTRIGNRVFFEVYMDWQPTHSTASGAAVFGGLPFTAASGSGPDYYSCSAGIMENIVFQGTDTGLVPVIAAGSTSFTLSRIRSNSSLANAGVAHFPTGVGFTLRVSGVYQV